MQKRAQRKLAVILHADVVESTQLVRKDESLAHELMQLAFQRFATTIEAYNGIAHELRGDALTASSKISMNSGHRRLGITVVGRLYRNTRPIGRTGCAIQAKGESSCV